MHPAGTELERIACIRHATQEGEVRIEKIIATLSESTSFDDFWRRLREFWPPALRAELNGLKKPAVLEVTNNARALLELPALEHKPEEAVAISAPTEEESGL